MQIQGLRLRNIRSFESAELDLTPGTTLIVGDVGAGKTSLLYAIEMALFGVAEVDAGYLVRHGRSDAEVRVRLGEAAHRFEIARKFRRVRRRGHETFEPEGITFSEDGRPTSYSATELRRRVIELVGFPDNPNPQAHSDLWRWAIYVPQERMREILSADPEERLETVRKALGVERFRTASENAATVASDLKVDARRRREEASRLAHWDEEWSKAARESDQLTLERRALEEGLARELGAQEEARRRLADAEAAVAGLQADQRELDGLTKDETSERRAAEEAERRATQLRAEIARAEEERSTARQAAASRADLAERLAGSDRERARLEGEIGRAEAELRALTARRAEIAAARRAAEELRRREERARGERDAASAALGDALAEGPAREPPAPTPRTVPEVDLETNRVRAEEHATVERLATARSDLGTIEELLRAGVCPTCHQTVRSAEFSEHVGEAREKVRAIEAERDGVRRVLEGLDAERKARERFERAHERWLEVDRRRTVLRESLAKWEEELRLASAALAEEAPPTTREPELDRRLAELASEQGALRGAWERTGGERAALQGELEKVARAEERLVGLQGAIDRAGSELGRLASERAVREGRAAERAARVEALHSRIRRLEALRRDVETSREGVRRRDESVAAAREAVVRADTRLEALAERIALAGRGRSERATLLEEAGGLEARASWIGDPLRRHLLAMEKDLLAHAQASFDRAFSRYFAALIDDPGLVARTDAAFTPQVTINGEVTPAEALSGGERTSLALAFRLALAGTVRALGEVRLETLLLDEPTDGFSSEQVIRMGELLEELALPQVIVVSHEAQLASIADRTLRVVKREGRSIVEAGDGSRPPPSLDSFAPGPDSALEGGRASRQA